MSIEWAAGLFEGEGCIHVWPTRAGGVLIVRMTDLDVLDRFQQVVGCGTLRGPLAPMKPQHKPSYEWRLCKWADVKRVLEEMYPLLGERRRAKADALFANPIGLKGREGQTHCLNSHPLSGPDADVRLITRKGGGTTRICRPCNRLRNAARKAQLRAEAAA